MTYLIILLVIVLLGLVALREWLIGHNPTKKKVCEIHKKVSQNIALNNWEKALKLLKPLQKKGVGGVESALLHIQILYGTKQYYEADRELEKQIKKYPNHLALQKEKGRVLLAQGKTKEAVTALKKSEPIFRSEEDRLDLATALFLEGNVEDSWACIREDLSNTTNGRLLALAGDCYFYRGRYSKAITFYKKTQKAGWTNYQVLIRMGHSLRCIGKLEEAEYHFRCILEKDPTDIFSTLGLGTALEARKEYAQALKVYQEGKAWDLGDPNILRQAGICAVHTEQFSFAEIYLRESISRGAESPQALAFLGFSLEKQQRWGEAEKIYHQLVEKYSSHVAGYRALAWLYGVGLSRTLDKESGLKMAHRALELLPDAASWEIISACEARAGNFKKAHTIQEKLSIQSHDENTRQRRRQAMRTLRKKIPLGENLVDRALVA